MLTQYPTSTVQHSFIHLPTTFKFVSHILEQYNIENCRVVLWTIYYVISTCQDFRCHGYSYFNRTSTVKLGTMYKYIIILKVKKTPNPFSSQSSLIQPRTPLLFIYSYRIIEKDVFNYTYHSSTAMICIVKYYYFFNSFKK